MSPEGANRPSDQTFHHETVETRSHETKARILHSHSTFYCFDAHTRHPANENFCIVTDLPPG
jgi:hypothetical protein